MLSTRDRFRDDLLHWAETHLREFLWREDTATLFETFVAEFFLTQTPAKNTAEVYPEFLNRFPSLDHIRDASKEELTRTIEPLGFQNMRAEALTEIANDHEELPTTVDELLDLPQVGPYVANATLCFALNRRLPIVDRNVNRVYGRVFGDRYPETEAARREFALALLPDDGSRARTYNLALLDFGAQLCTKRRPKCSDCFARHYCSYYQSTVTESDALDA